jgi:hypothetical protein
MSKGKGGSKAAGGGGGASPKGGGGSLKEIVDGVGLFHSDYLRSGMRDLTFARSHYAGMSAKEADRYARTSAYPVRVSVEPGRGGKPTVHLGDGRHRMTAAREAGAKYIRATVTRYGPRGGVKGKWTGPVRIG